MIRLIKYRPLGEGQRVVLMLGTEAEPVTLERLESPGHKVVLHGLKRMDLIDKQGFTTEAGRRALIEGRIPYEADPLVHDFESNVRRLMEAWKVKRPVAIRRAIANAVKRLDALDDEQKGDA